MEINLLRLLFHPSASVKETCEKPDFNTSFFMVLLPGIILLLTLLISQLKFDFFSIAAYTLKNYVLWFVVSASIYFFAFLAKGKEIKGKFAAIYSNTSFIWLFISIAILLIFLSSIAFSPKFFALVRVVKNENLNMVQAGQLMKILSSNDATGLAEFQRANSIKSDLSGLLPGKGSELVNSQAMSMTLIACAILFFYALFIYPFFTIKYISKLNAASSFIVYVFSMGVILVFAFGVSLF